MDMNIREIRSNFEKVGILYNAADNIEIEKESIETVTCYWFYKAKAKSTSRVIVYLHGGCYVFGSIDSHRALVSHLASETNSTILFIEYSLAPESVFPTAINEVLKVYNHLVTKLKAPSISFMGDSAGPGLITSVVSILNKEKNNINLRQCIMLSPWVDLRNNSESITKNKDIDPVLTKEGLEFFASLYIGNNKLSEINPIETLFGTFPPTLILVGTNEILLDDSRELFSKIAAAQPLTELTIYENQTHVWLTNNIYSEPSKRAIEQIKKFVYEYA
jgi:monoterpene epsilon-lactone hydrolase